METHDSSLLKLFVLAAVGCLSAIPASAQIVSPIVAQRGTTPRGAALTNLSAHATPDAPIDPSLPTYVVTHGWNPLPNHVRLTTPEAYAHRIRARFRGRVNVLAFHWDSRGQGSYDANNVNAVRSGVLLGQMLLERGVDPGRTVMIGHSMGTVVIAAAANSLHLQTGRVTKRLVLIDGPKRRLQIAMRDLRASQCARAVVNVWAPGLTGLGGPLNGHNVTNIKAPDRTSWQPGRSLPPTPTNHLDVLLWFYENLL